MVFNWLVGAISYVVFVFGFEFPIDNPFVIFMGLCMSNHRLNVGYKDLFTAISVRTTFAAVPFWVSLTLNASKRFRQTNGDEIITILTIRVFTYYLGNQLSLNFFDCVSETTLNFLI